MRDYWKPLFAVAVACVVAVSLNAVNATQADNARPPIDPDDIGGVVPGSNGPEAGVWVIAETTSLPTKFREIVVTDDQGRFVLPDLPRNGAPYKLWVRGYGLIDSEPVTSPLGRHVALRAAAAPTPQAAAQYYPASHWYSLIKVPDASEFPGTGPSGNGISPQM